MSPDVIISLANLFKLAEVFTNQVRGLLPQPEETRTEEQVTAQIDEQNELVVKKEGEVVQKISASDFQAADENKRLLISTLEKSMDEHFKRWTALYQKIATSDDSEISEKYRAKLIPIAKQMCSDWELLLKYLREIGKPVDKAYGHIRFICAQTKISDPGSRRRLMSSNRVKIIVAVLGLIGALGAAYMQFVCNPKGPTNSVDYSGRVLSEDTNKPVQGAKVTLEIDQTVPENVTTDSDGVFHFHVNGTPNVVRVRVGHASFQPFDRNVPLSRSGLEDIRLKPIANEPTKPVFGLTYGSNPTLEQIRQDLQTTRHVKISYGSKCPRSIGKSVVQLNGAQINASDVKQYLEQVSPRTNVKFFVTVVSEGAAYEIVCQ